jgi:death-on-curing protein
VTRRREPVWLDKRAVLATHHMLLAEFGGSPGLRDETLLDSALARPRNRRAYEAADIVSLAASYAAGIVGNHPFIDGNKRTGFMAAYIFLERNGMELIAPHRILGEDVQQRRPIIPSPRVDVPLHRRPRPLFYPTGSPSPIGSRGLSSNERSAGTSLEGGHTNSARLDHIGNVHDRGAR